MIEFFGHQEVWTKLKVEVDQNHLATAYLFYGPPGIGKKLVALKWVQYLFCENNNDQQMGLLSDAVAVPKPCGECAACKRVEAKSHPDFFYLEANGKNLKIDQFRQLSASLFKAPLEAVCKIIVIDDAHMMTTQAANSVLKLLEEPPAHTHFILLAPNLFQFLPTIRSRCRHMIFKTPNIDESLGYFMQETECDEHKAKDFLELADGSVGLALAYHQQDLEEALTVMDAVIEKRTSFHKITLMVHDLVQKKVDMDLLLEAFKRRLFRRMKELDDWSHIGQVEKIQDVQRDIGFNVNKTLALENMFLDLMS